MRLLLTTVIVLAGTAASASSITAIGGTHPVTHSIVEKRCADCAPAQARIADTAAYKVPELAPGTQKVEVIDIGGEKKLVRTEAWFGGSPVVHVSKLPEWMSEERAIAEIHPTTGGSTEAQIVAIRAAKDGVDTEAMTGAVGAELPVSHAAMVGGTLSFQTFELRLQ